MQLLVKHIGRGSERQGLIFSLAKMAPKRTKAQIAQRREDSATRTAQLEAVAMEAKAPKAAAATN